jgi:Tfp pilus assembly major pilin PilA
MQRPNKQKGMTAIGWLLVIAIVAIFALMLLKLMPVYLEGYKITSALDALATDASVRGKNPNELKKVLLRRFDIDSIYDIKSDDINITRSSNGYSVEIDYEPRVSFIGNLYFVVVFDKTVEVPSN